jgi:hypothetical protein
MRLGETGSDDYLAGWMRGPWTPGNGDHGDLAASVAQQLEAEWEPQRIADYLDALGPAHTAEA